MIEMTPDDGKVSSDLIQAQTRPLDNHQLSGHCAKSMFLDNWLSSAARQTVNAPT
jgi:hypothetical protein